jgi:hypothetical protein
MNLIQNRYVHKQQAVSHFWRRFCLQSLRTISLWSQSLRAGKIQLNRFLCHQESGNLTSVLAYKQFYCRSHSFLFTHNSFGRVCSPILSPVRTKSHFFPSWQSCQPYSHRLLPHVFSDNFNCTNVYMQPRVTEVLTAAASSILWYLSAHTHIFHWLNQQLHSNISDIYTTWITKGLHT